ncbi:unnamed protein product [Hymenolepis diminuta]|uniref:Septin-type G domain-containing protein n=1 Tax=Hymenolepis diminuta TaxID=6216 RepID=A0A0R3SCF5_HYMDI|nr:unnamed protein product [Hymenolepis diminuta]
MTVEECKQFKTSVASQLIREGINTYDFPLSDIPEISSGGSNGVSTVTPDSRVAEVKRLRLRQPFAVCTSSQVITKDDGTKVRCRVYPWGTVETDSLEHNDFQALKTLLMRHFMQDLIDVTYTNHYSNYRTNRLKDVMQAANFSLQDGREPLCQLDSERRAHQIKLDKLVEEMNQVYVEKVREREKRLKDSERDMAERIRQMQQQLELEAEDLANARQAFNDERVTWEMENRDYADETSTPSSPHVSLSSPIGESPSQSMTFSIKIVLKRAEKRSHSTSCFWPSSLSLWKRGSSSATRFQKTSTSKKHKPNQEHKRRASSAPQTGYRRTSADSVCGSMEKLEKIKKHRRGLF